jgi:hypothetical protein
MDETDIADESSVYPFHPLQNPLPTSLSDTFKASSYIS